MPLAEALRIIDERISAVAAAETAPLARCHGRILAEPVRAERNAPPHDNSAVDGYAVYFDDLAPGGTTVLPVSGRAAAGRFPAFAARRGAAVRIFTGAPIPRGESGDGPDTVFMQEDCVRDGARVALPAGISRGANRRRAGEDVAAGHLARAAHEVGFKLHVIDDREKFANAERFPHAGEIVVDAIPAWLEQADLPAHAYAVILTRGHRHDLDALRALASKPIRYLGLIGSRAKVARLTEVLEGEGVPAEQLRRVRSPVGLDLGAVTPQEIAVSILAELIGVKYGRIDADAGGTGARDARSMSWSPRPRPEAAVSG